jgi:hypothetical protein
MQKGDKLGIKIAQLKFRGLKSNNCEIYEVKIAQLKIKGSKSHNCETWDIKTAFNH